jgi:uncharacterized protein (DUF427 family)
MVFLHSSVRWLAALVKRAFLNCRSRVRSNCTNGRLTMPKAIWNGVVLAESDRCEVVEGNQYFPPESVKRAHLKDSATHTICPWKGTASYYDVVVNGQTNKDAAWYYPAPKDAAKQIKDHVAFWHGVTVEV